jgi:hypothetical protein
MRCALAGILLGFLLLTAGCAPGLQNLSLNPDPAQRMRELLNDSDHAETVNPWSRIWDTEEESHLNPQRITGGIQ